MLLLTYWNTYHWILGGIRTADPRICSHLLCHLSYHALVDTYFIVQNFVRTWWLVTLFTGVRVRSWSKNCPYCISMSVYRPCRCETSAWTTIETRRGLGSGFPLKARKRGREIAAKIQGKIKRKSKGGGWLDPALFLNVAIPMELILSILMIVLHISHLTEKCTGIINQQGWTILMFRWSSTILRISEQVSLTSSS